jgi:hypothetical protein
MGYHRGMGRSLVIVSVLAACSRGGDHSEAKQWQSDPPPPKIDVPAGLQIAVSIDGQPRAPVTTDTLNAIKPDYEDDEHRVWMITSLVPEATPSPASIQATSPAGMSITLAHPMPDGYEPALFLSRRGEIKVAAVDPKVPIPPWHGHGGRLHRAGDSMPHIGPVSKLEITHAPRP